ncbi:3-oxoacid CoA-transferase subunit B [Peribacillus sp. TH24]|uniref:3-oxoacid CoA-transferase subunit B n=1 Tax=Peribacillus sp. TH24 TaxID=2798483 RepID=UPI001914281F|nr:3-oxoacid CoA-transferase subunit B [Peribacillus sp. TH24]MBK5446929.1 3-oxoacid CoA-transferase subunit B [Peribacillus sp. TH24]
MSIAEKRALDKKEIQHLIAKRVAKELTGPCMVNLGIGIPTLVAEYIHDENVFLHTENGLLGVTDVEEQNIDPNLVNAGKLPVGEAVGASYFDSASSFAMIRGGHIDVAILGVLQVDQIGMIANWAVPGKNIMGVGGAMDLLVGAKKVILAMTHTNKDGSSKILKECTYPITSIRSVDKIITELAVFEVVNKNLRLVELMPGVTIEEVRAKTEADFTEKLGDVKQ